MLDLAIVLLTGCFVDYTVELPINVIKIKGRPALDRWISDNFIPAPKRCDDTEPRGFVDPKGNIYKKSGSDWLVVTKRGE